MMILELWGNITKIVTSCKVDHFPLNGRDSKKVCGTPNNRDISGRANGKIAGSSKPSQNNDKKGFVLRRY